MVCVDVAPLHERLTNRRNSSKRSPDDERSQRMPMGVIWLPTTTMHPSSHEPNPVTPLRSHQRTLPPTDGASHHQVDRLLNLGHLGSTLFTLLTMVAKWTSYSFMDLVGRASGHGQNTGIQSYSGRSPSCRWSKTSAWRGY